MFEQIFVFVICYYVESKASKHVFGLMTLSKIPTFSWSSTSNFTWSFWVLISSHFCHLQLLNASIHWFGLRSLVLPWGLFSGTVTSLRNAPLLAGCSHYFRLFSTHVLISRSIRNSLKVIADVLRLLCQVMPWHKRHASWVIILILNISESFIGTMHRILLGGPLWIVTLNIWEVSCWDSSLSDKVFGHVPHSWLCAQNVIGAETVHTIKLIQNKSFKFQVNESSSAFLRSKEDEGLLSLLLVFFLF